MIPRKMVCLNIRIKKNDEVKGKRLEETIIDFLMESKVLGTIVWLGVDGFGKRGRSTVHLEGLMINQSLMIETIGER